VWAPFDEIVTGARDRGLGVLFQLGGSAPEWATPGKKRSAINSPNPKEFRAFVKAVGTRYSGVYNPNAPSSGGGLAVTLPIAAPGQIGAPQAPGALPRVTLYSVWNEPNLVSWLAPQTRRGVPYSPFLYRRLLYAAGDGLQDSGHSSDQLLLGELQPFAGIRAGSKKTRPLAFLRELACVNRRFRAYRGKAAKRRGCTGRFRRLPGTGVAFHPYTLAGGPNVKVRNRDDASIATLGRVTRTIDRLAARHRLAHGRLPLWITEFGFQSRPPDPFATPIRRIPSFMAQSERIAFRNRRVLSFAQYPLVDDPALGGFQSGLRFKNGRAKPFVYSAFRHTIYVRRLSRSSVEVFGGERAAGGGTVTIQARRGRRGAWRNVATAGLNGRGYFDRRVRFGGAASRQYRYVFGSTRSRAAGVSRR
jgi:hypothetical protein